MAEPVLKVNLAIDNKVEEVPYTSTSTAEDVCIFLCRKLGIGTIARHLFALRVRGKQTVLIPSATFTEKVKEYDLRIRFKVASVMKMKKIDIKAYDYYFHQARSDVLENKIPDLEFEKYRKEILGLGIADMYRVMLEKEIVQETVESDYKKYIPKEVLKRHPFFIKKPIHDTLSKIKKSGHDAWFVKAQYLRQLELLVPEYLAEEYKAVTEDEGTISSIIVRVSPFAFEPGIKYCMDSKKDKWHCICPLEDLGFISLRKDSTVEISRRNGIPFYLKFSNMQNMLSFVSLVDGYYRLSVKWTFNICKDVITPSLLKLYSMKCHGPVGGEFSYAKLEEKRGNTPGCFILRESDSKYNIYYIDVCVKDSSKPQTFKLEYVSADEFIFHNDLTRYKTIQQLMNVYCKEDGVIFLGECLPPSENEKSPLLLCQSDSLTGDSLIDSSTVENLYAHPRCINSKDLQIYKGKKCLKWNKKRPRVRIGNEVVSQDIFHKSLFPDESTGYAKKHCRNPDADPGGPWCFVEAANKKEVEKEYCDVPFCQSVPCSAFTGNSDVYTHYTRFPETLTNFTFGVKLWHPDSYLTADARLVLSLFALPLTSKQIHSLGIGLEITISNKKAGLTAGNADKVEYEDTFGVLKAHEFTYFTLTWWHNIITLSREGTTKPVFMSDYKGKRTLMGFKPNQFRYYSVQGADVLWSLPYCDDSDQCDVHTTIGSEFQRYSPLPETSVGYDLNFRIRAVKSAYIRLATSPLAVYPSVKVMIQRTDNYTRVEYQENQKSPTVVLEEKLTENLLNYWTWQEFTLGIFMGELQLYITKDSGTYAVIQVAHEGFKKLRWYSPSSENSIAQWTFSCLPPSDAVPPASYPPECALNKKEPDYNGTQDLTSAGIPCLPWGGNELLPRGEIEELFEDEGEKYEAWNYCRDPKNKLEGTFCYVLSENPYDSDTPARKEYCRIRKCKSAECKVAGTGNDYIGKASTTRSNRTCQRWISPQKLKMFDDIEKMRIANLTNLTETIAEKNVQVPSVKLKRLSDGQYSQSELVQHLLDLHRLFEEMGCKDRWKCLREIYGSDGGEGGHREVDIGRNVRNKDGDEVLSSSEAVGVEAETLTEETHRSGTDLNTVANFNGVESLNDTQVSSTDEIGSNTTVISEEGLAGAATQISSDFPSFSEKNLIGTDLLNVTEVGNVDSITTTANLNIPEFVTISYTANNQETPSYNETTSPPVNFSDPSQYFNISQNPPHKEEVASLAQAVNEQKAIKTLGAEDEETQTSRYDFPYIHDVNVKLLNETLFADMDLKKIRNYCRNPSRDTAGTWCYTEDPEVEVDLCNVRDCDKIEECTIYLKGDAAGRKLYILPQWKEAGIHGGLRFAVKQWNPDLVAGLALEFLPLTGTVTMRLVIGADNNERIKLFYDDELVKDKSMPHVIASGKWENFWLQTRIGEVVLGYEGVPLPVFTWNNPNASDAMNPIFLKMLTINGFPLGLSFKCDECYTEITTTDEFSKIFPIGLWMEEETYHRKLVLHLRGTGKVMIPLYVLLDTREYFCIEIADRGATISFSEYFWDHRENLKTSYTNGFQITETNWTTVDISFTESRINITSNKQTLLSYKSKYLLLFYWFSLGVEQGSITWSANCDPLDIDGDPLDGGWSKWSSWVCTVPCGGGTGYRTRTCSNPRPNIFGRLCEGPPTSTGMCNDFECGDVNPDTMEMIREELRANYTSLIAKEKESVLIENNPMILGRLSTESPDAYYEWTLNGIFVKPQPGRVDFVGDDIVIKKAKASDSGVYVCVFFRIKKQRLVFRVVSLAVIPKKIQIDTRATRQATLSSNAVVLGYIYTNLKQKWILNETIYSDYGLTTLAAIDHENLSPLNRSHTGEWKCVVEQPDLGFSWTTNIVKMRVKKAPNFFTNMMEYEFTAPLFGWLKTDTNVAIALVLIVLFIVLSVALCLWAYLKYGRLPELNGANRKARNRRFMK